MKSASPSQRRPLATFGGLDLDPRVDQWRTRRRWNRWCSRPLPQPRTSFLNAFPGARRSGAQRASDYTPTSPRFSLSPESLSEPVQQSRDGVAISLCCGAEPSVTTSTVAGAVLVVCFGMVTTDRPVDLAGSCLESRRNDNYRREIKRRFVSRFGHMLHDV